MKDPDCGCEINDIDIPKKEFVFKDNSVGEEIFDEEDLFENVKEYYKNYSKPNKQCEDLLLENLIPKKNNDFILINELLDLEKKDRIIKKDILKTNIEEPIIEKDKEEEKKYYDINKTTKINYIKNYLNKLKDGS